jgi:TRAP-type C4-dicarboxylate transport system permease small subunit
VNQAPSVEAPRVAAPPAYRQVRKAIDAADAVLVTIGCAMLFAMMCVVVADVSLRYLANAPLQWSYEVISNYLMPGFFFMAASHTLKAHAHVSVDIIHNYLRRRTRYALEGVVSVVALPVFALCTWVAAGKTWNDFVTAAVSSTGLPVPTWTMSLLFPVGFGLLTLRLLTNALGYFASLYGREVIELPPISGSHEGAE